MENGEYKKYNIDGELEENSYYIDDIKIYLLL